MLSTSKLRHVATQTSPQHLGEEVIELHVTHHGSGSAGQGPRSLRVRHHVLSAGALSPCTRSVLHELLLPASGSVRQLPQRSMASDVTATPTWASATPSIVSLEESKCQTLERPDEHAAPAAPVPTEEEGGTEASHAHPRSAQHTQPSSPEAQATQSQQCVVERHLDVVEKKPTTPPIRLNLRLRRPPSPPAVEPPPDPAPTRAPASPGAPDTPLDVEAASRYRAYLQGLQLPEQAQSGPTQALPLAGIEQAHTAPPLAPSSQSGKDGSKQAVQQLRVRLASSIAAIREQGARLPARVGRPLKHALASARQLLQALEAQEGATPEELDRASAAVDGVDIAFAAAREYIAFKLQQPKPHSQADGSIATSAKTSLSAELGLPCPTQSLPGPGGNAPLIRTSSMPVVEEASSETPHSVHRHDAWDAMTSPPLRVPQRHRTQLSRGGSLRERRTGKGLALRIGKASPQHSGRPASHDAKQRAQSSHPGKAAQPGTRTGYLYPEEAKAMKKARGRAHIMQATKLQHVSQSVLFTPKGNVKVSKASTSGWLQ